MALSHHAGWETGNLAEWATTSGTPTVVATHKTGSYGMRCNATGTAKYAYVNIGRKRASFWFQRHTTPSADCRIAGTDTTTSGAIYLTTANKLDLRINNVSKSLGTTVLAVDTWYRVSISVDLNNGKIYLDGNVECSAADANFDYVWGTVGACSAVTVDLYFDDYVLDDTATTDDLGDYRVALALPNADGVNQDMKRDEVGVSRPFYDSVNDLNNAAGVDGSYVWYDDSVDAADSEDTYALQDCATIGLAAGDTIGAVHIVVRMKRGSGSGGVHSIVEYDTANTETAVAPTTSFANYRLYRATAPTSGAWTQAIFNAYEVGFGNDNAGAQDTYCSCVNVTVAFKLSTGAVTETINDTVGLTDDMARASTFVRALTESMGVTDASPRIFTAVRSFADSIGLTDSQTQVLGLLRTIADSLALSDDMARSWIASRTIAETLGLTDARTSTSTFVRVMTDSMGILDTMAETWAAVRTLADSLGLSDSLAKGQGKTLADTLGITDSAVRICAVIRAIADPLGITDSPIHIWAAVRTIADTLGLTDLMEYSLSGGEAITRTINDALGLTDATDRTCVALRTVSEVLGMTDSLAKVLGVSRVVSDSEGLTDGVVLGRMVVVANTVGVTDALTTVVNYLRTQQDEVGLLDAMARLTAATRTVNDTVGLTDQMSEQIGGLVQVAWAFLLMKHRR